MFGASHKGVAAFAFEAANETEGSAPSWLTHAKSGSDAVIVSLRPPRLPTDLGAGFAEPEIPRPPPAPRAVPEERRARGGKTDTVIDELIPRADEEAIVAIRDAVSSLVAQRKAVLEQSEKDMLGLVRVIAERVVARELSSHPSVIRDLVHEGISALASSDAIMIRIGSFFGDVRDEIEAAVRRTGVGVEVVVDPSLGLYGCRVQTQWGSVDESVESRLANVLDSLGIGTRAKR